MSEVEIFRKQVQSNIEGLGKDKDMKDLSRIWLRDTLKHKYTYNFSWLGRPIIQYPQDIVAMQEIIWRVKPDLIIETGIAHGGSLIFSASMLAQLDMCEAIEAGVLINPSSTKRKVLAVDIDIREHNRKAIESHPMSSRIQMIQGSSIDESVVSKVQNIAKNYEKILVCLDSNHTHEHVIAELHAYAEMVSINSYCVVFDTVIEDLPKDSFPNRPWGVGNNPRTAVNEFLVNNNNYVVDREIENKIMITVAAGGFLKRIG